jgi:SSS family solute:Na+ symporter
MAAFTLIMLSLFFVPFYIRAKVATLPDFLEKRYNGACRDILAVISVFSAIFIHIGFSLYTGGVVLQGMFGIPLLLSIIAICALVGVYHHPRRSLRSGHHRGH